MTELVYHSRGTGLAGKLRLRPGDDGAPLLVCVHGGGCTGRYFEVGPHSTMEAALARGFSVLLVDRPGFGRSTPPTTSRPVAEAADRLIEAVAELREQRLGEVPTVIIGHSIGGAVALTVAGSRRSWPLAGIAVSGIGDAPSAAAARWFSLVQRGEADIEPPSSFFFGPEGSFSWQGPLALRRASAPWRCDEVMEVMEQWPRHFGDVARQVEIPIFLRLAEHERIWEVGDVAVARIAEKLYRSPRADVAMLPGGGHLYEFHRAGAGLISAELDFLIAAIGQGGFINADGLSK